MEIRVTGVDQIIAKLKAYQKSLEDKQHRFLEELAKIGIDTAKVYFGKAEYDGDFDVVVNGSPEWVGDNRLFISASGHSITFVEFGTGVHYVEQHPKANEFGFVRGTYGQGKGSRDAWGYYGSRGSHGIGYERSTDRGVVTITHGNPPARAMYEAGKEMRNQIVKIAKGVFGSD